MFAEYGASAGVMFRFFCLQVPWNSNVDFSHDRMVDASKLIEKFKLFILNASQAICKIDQRDKRVNSNQVCSSFLCADLFIYFMLFF
jgi:cysteinyl-tRNA synthetase